MRSYRNNRNDYRYDSSESDEEPEVKPIPRTITKPVIASKPKTQLVEEEAPRSPRLGSASPRVSTFPTLNKVTIPRSPKAQINIPPPKSPKAQISIPPPRSPRTQQFPIETYAQQKPESVPKSPPAQARKITIPAPKTSAPKSPKVTNILPNQKAFPVPQTRTMPKTKGKIPLPVVPVEEPVLIENITGKRIEYRESQREWANKSFNILLHNHGYIDTSQPRAGKTYISLGLAQKFGFRLLVICPVNVLTMWKKTAEEYGIELVDRKLRNKDGELEECREPISYESLRGMKPDRINHGLLERIDNTTTGGIHQVIFKPTEYYLSLVAKGLLIICDEIHMIKNNSGKYKACSALIHPILTGGLSRFGLLSGTPIDKQEQAINLLKLIGYIRSFKLYYKNGKNIILEGAQELINACEKIDANTTAAVIENNPITTTKTHEKVIELCYELYIKVIKESISGAMPGISNIEGELDIKNGYYHIDPRKIEQLQTAINELDRSVGFLGTFATSLVKIEESKAFDMARVAEKILKADPQNKVIISLNYNNTIDEINYYLEEYNPLIFRGNLNTKQRDIVVDLFNNDPTRRLLLMNTTLALGRTFHDTTGDSPRFMLISPSYKLLDVIQASYRIYGDGLKTKATVRIFYGIVGGGSEAEILERKFTANMKQSLNKKSQVLEQTLETDLQGDIKLPSHYQTEYEQ